VALARIAAQGCAASRDARLRDAGDFMRAWSLAALATTSLATVAMGANPSRNGC
jgi:hypothetical protein